MAYGRGLHGGSSGGGNHRGRPYVVVFLLAFGAALIGVMVLHKLRERRIYNLLLKEKDRHLLSLHLLLQKERDGSKELKMKNEEMKAGIYSLKSQKMELERKALEMQSIMDSLVDEQKVLESAYEEKQNEIRMLQGEKLNLGKENPELMALTENLKKKEAEIEDLRHRLQVLVDKSHRPSCDEASSNLPENLSANERVMAEDHKIETGSKEKDENSHDYGQYGNGKDSIKNDDGETRTGIDEIRERMGNNDILVETSQQYIKRPETLQVDGTNSGVKITDKEQGGEHDDAREIDSKMVNVKNETIREERPGQLENNLEGRGEILSASQLGDNSGFAANMKGKYSSRLGRTKGKRWRIIMNNRLQQNIGVSNRDRAENRIHLKDRTRRAFSDDENNVKREDGNNVKSEDEEMSDYNPSTDKREAKLVKVESPEDRNKRVDGTNNQMTNISSINTHPRKQRLAEVRQLENQAEVTHNNVEKEEKAKSGTFHEENQELDELTIADAEEQERDVIDGDDGEDNNDNFFKESQTDFEDEKEDYKEEIDQS